MPEQQDVMVPVPADMVSRLLALLDRIERQAPPDPDRPIIIRPLKKAFAMAGVGNTAGHRLIREGVFEVVSIGKRGKGITRRSIERLGTAPPPSSEAA